MGFTNISHYPSAKKSEVREVLLMRIQRPYTSKSVRFQYATLRAIQHGSAADLVCNPHGPSYYIPGGKSAWALQCHANGL